MSQTLQLFGAAFTSLFAGSGKAIMGTIRKTFSGPAITQTVIDGRPVFLLRRNDDLEVVPLRLDVMTTFKIVRLDPDGEFIGDNPSWRVVMTSVAGPSEALATFRTEQEAHDALRMINRRLLNDKSDGISIGSTLIGLLIIVIIMGMLLSASSFTEPSMMNSLAPNDDAGLAAFGLKP